MRTPFENPVCPTPSAEGNHSGTRGGSDIGGSEGRKETPGTIPNQPTITSVEGASSPGERSIKEYEASKVWHNAK